MAQHCLRPARDSRSTDAWMLGNKLGSGKWPVFQDFSS